MVKEFYYANERRLSVNQARRRRCERNFLAERGPDCLGVAIAHDLYRTMGNIDVCAESELLEVKVPIVFLGTVGFSPRREGR